MMSKKDYLEILSLLSALESWSYSHDRQLPDWLQENLDNSIDKLKAEVLRENGLTLQDKCRGDKD
jgi:hypothetical protein